METLILSISKAMGISAELMMAICMVESNCKSVHTMDKGSMSYGAFQIKYKTAKMFNPMLEEHQLKNTKINVLYAAKYIKYLMKRYDHNELCVIAAYNAGYCGKAKFGFNKNESYVKKVLKHYKPKKRLYAIREWSRG